jgi:hypothetical protein
MDVKLITEDTFIESSDFSTLDPAAHNVVIFIIEQIKKGGVNRPS